MAGVSEQFQNNEERFDYENWLSDVANKGILGEVCKCCDQLLVDHSIEDDIDCQNILASTRRSSC